jgi:sortase A
VRSLQELLIFAGAVLLGTWLQAGWNERAFQRHAAERLEALGARPASGEGRAIRARHEARQSGVIGRLAIPRLGIDAAVSEGIDDRTLDRAVGHIPHTPFPGERGNVGLAGHRDTFFRGLDRLERGDRIRLTTPDGAFEYRVVGLQVVTPRATRVLDDDGTELLTLVTCYPLRVIGPAPDRLVVQARAIAPSGRSATSSVRLP